MTNWFEEMGGKEEGDRNKEEKINLRLIFFSLIFSLSLSPFLPSLLFSSFYQTWAKLMHDSKELN